MSDKELLQQALDALEYVIESVGGNAPVSYDVWFQRTQVPAEALRARLTQCDAGEICLSCQVCPDAQPIQPDYSKAGFGPPQREQIFCGCGDQIVADDGAECGNCVSARNAAKREWVTLTDDEIRIAWGPYFSRGVDVARVIEALLKRKNT